MLRDAAEKTGNVVGDGTSTYTVLSHALLADGIGEAGAAPGALCLLFNASRSITVRFLPPPAGAWHIAIDTAASPPCDATDPGAESPAPEQPSVLPRALLVLLSR